MQAGLLAGRVHVDAGVVAGDVNRAPPRDDAVNHLLNIRGRADVCDQRHATNPCMPKQMN